MLCWVSTLWQLAAICFYSFHVLANEHCHSFHCVARITNQIVGESLLGVSGQTFQSTRGIMYFMLYILARHNFEPVVRVLPD